MLDKIILDKNYFNELIKEYKNNGSIIKLKLGFLKFKNSDYKYILDLSKSNNIIVLKNNKNFFFSPSTSIFKFKRFKEKVKECIDINKKKNYHIDLFSNNNDLLRIKINEDNVKYYKIEKSNKLKTDIAVNKVFMRLFLINKEAEQITKEEFLNIFKETKIIKIRYKIKRVYYNDNFNFEFVENKINVLENQIEKELKNIDKINYSDFKDNFKKLDYKNNLFIELIFSKNVEYYIKFLKSFYYIKDEEDFNNFLKNEDFSKQNYSIYSIDVN